MCVHKAFKFNVDKAIGTFINAKIAPTDINYNRHAIGEVLTQIHEYFCVWF